MEHEPWRRAPRPKDRISLSRQGIVGGIDLHGIKMGRIKSKAAFRSSDLPRVEGAAFDQGLVRPRGRAHPDVVRADHVAQSTRFGIPPKGAIMGVEAETCSRSGFVKGFRPLNGYSAAPWSLSRATRAAACSAAFLLLPVPRVVKKVPTLRRISNFLS
jgi:hypothetical protein